MNATSLSELRGAGLPRDVADDKMEQIRDLLFGEFKRESDARLALMEARLREIETTLTRRLEAVEARLDALNGEINAERRMSFDELSRSVFELGDRIRRISHG